MKDIKKNKKKHSYGVTIFVFILLIVIMVYIYMLSDAQLYIDDMSFGEIVQQVTDSKSSFRGVDKILELVYGNDDSQGGASGGIVTAAADGKLITDATINPYGLPLYDGFTMSVDDLKSFAQSKGIDGSYIKSWDIVYSQFWDGTIASSDARYGLGDFSGENRKKNGVSFDLSRASGKWSKSSAYYIVHHDSPTAKPTAIPNKNNFNLVDGRFVVALPWRVISDPDLVTPEIEKLFSETSNTVNTSGAPDITGGRNLGSVWSSSKSAGLYVDVILDDGTVIPCIVGDAKGVHMGVYSNGDVCEDVPMEGYAHLRWAGSKGNYGYMGILEFILWDKQSLDGIYDVLHLSGRKIVGTRTYSVQHWTSAQQYIQWFTEGSVK